MQADSLLDSQSAGNLRDEICLSLFTPQCFQSRPAKLAEPE